MFTTPSLQISYPLFEWIQTLPLEGLNIIMGALLVASVFFTVGFLYRLSSLVMFLAHGYFFLLDRTNYSDTHYLMLICNFLFFLVDAHRTHSVDNFFFFKNAKSAVPYWQIFTFQMQFSIVLFYMGLSKATNIDWIRRGEPILTKFFMGSAMNPFIRLPFVAEVADDEMLRKLSLWFSYATFTTEMLAALGPWLTDMLGSGIKVLALISLHVANFLRVLLIGEFDNMFYLIALSSLFWISTSHSHALLDNFFMGKFFAQHAASETRGQSVFKKLAFIVAIVFLFAQAAAPLRPFAYRAHGDPNWTKEGYLFSWREGLNDDQVMLRWEGVEIGQRYTVAGVSAKNTDAVKLINGQRNRLMKDPLSILQAGKAYVNALLESRSIFAENVTVDAWRSLNGRPFQRWINPSKNLLDFNYDATKGHSSWLLQPIPEANSREWLTEMRSVSDANIRKSLETVFFADRPGGEFQANLAELALKATITCIKGNIEVEVQTSERTDPEVNKMRAGDKINIAFNKWHTIRVIGESPALYSYSYNYPAKVSFPQAINM
jgi:hypothetical protein